MSVSKGTFLSVDDYINSFPEDTKTLLETLRQIIKEVAPEATEAIKYGMPTFVLHGNLVYFAAWKKHIGFYPITAEMEASLDELAEYKTSGKGTIQFPIGKPLPLPLIRKIIAFRVAEHLANEAQRNPPTP
jgi:uncharacterized protein YdhG (YjbR/CyaY superfamily)